MGCRGLRTDGMVHILEIQNTDKCTMNVGTQTYVLAVRICLIV